jgi:hypothetical protein
MSILVLLGVLGAVLAYAVPALAEFTSTNGKAVEGETGEDEFTVKGGGATISCIKASGAWVIEKGKEKVVKGPTLLEKIKSLGSCGVETSELKEGGEASGIGCEAEMTEAKAESSISAGLLSNCTLKFTTGKKEACEVKLESTNNKELKSVSLSYGGGENENTVIQYAASNAVTTVNKACESAGVKGTKEAKLEGWVTAKQVQPGVPAPEFTITHAGGASFMTTLGETRTMPVRRVRGAGNASPASITSTEEFGGGGTPAEPYWETTNVANCTAQPYANGEFCLTPIKVKLLKTRALNRSSVSNFFVVVSPGGERSRDYVGI